MIEYTILPDKNDDSQFLIGINDEPWIGVVIKINAIRIEEEGEKEEDIRLQFGYDVVEKPEWLQEGVLEGEYKEELEQHIGDIIVDIATHKAEEVVNGTNRDNDIEEFDT